MLNENVSEIDFLFTSKMSKGNMTISFIYSHWNEYVYRTHIAFLRLMPNYLNFHLYVIYPIAIFNERERK